MKLLMLNYEFPPLGGGAANANYYLLKEFSKNKDLKIDLITSSPNSYKEENFSENIHLYRLPVGKKNIHYWTQFEILKYSWKAYQLANNLKKENEYDLVHAWFGVPCGYIAKKLNLPYIIALRGSDVPGYNKRFSLQYVILKPLIKGIWENAENVIANSEGLKILAQKTKDIPIDIIHNGVNVKEFTPRFNDNKKLQVLCVSRLISRKGINYLIEAMEDIEAELTIIGKGKQEKELKRIAAKFEVQDKIDFLGYVPHEKISDYYSKADVFVLPSLNEGMSNTLLEAMAAGLPIITTDTGGTRELIHGNGFVVPMRDPASLREAISKYLITSKLLEKHGKKSRRIAKEMSWAGVADKYWEVYLEVAHG